MSGYPRSLAIDGKTVGDGTCNMLCHHEDSRIDTRQVVVAAISQVDAGLPSARIAVTVRRDWTQKKNPGEEKSHTRFFLSRWFAPFRRLANVDFRASSRPRNCRVRTGNLPGISLRSGAKNRSTSNPARSDHPAVPPNHNP